MGLIGQVSLARAGTALELEFDVEDLKDVVENQARPFGHVTLHPGDFTSLDQEIQIPEGVAVTILPGADVEYTDNFRDPGCPDECAVFDHDGNPNDSTEDHPLAGDFKRYERPNFTGHVENVADLNLASEWALETTPQIWTAARAGADAEIDVLTGDADENLRTLSFRGGPGAEVAVQEDTREVQVSLDPEDFVQSINFNRLVFEESNKSVGNLNVSHESINTDFNPDPGTDENDPGSSFTPEEDSPDATVSGARIVRGISIHKSEPSGQTAENDGHVERVEDAYLLEGPGVNIKVAEVGGAPDEITIDASGAADAGVTSISTGSDLTVNQSTGAVTISHDVNGGGSSGNSDGTVIQDVVVNDDGHVTSVNTTGLDSRYVLESGDTITGSLTIESSLTVEGSFGFDSGASVNEVRTSVRDPGGNDKLVTEKAVRDEISALPDEKFVSGTSYNINNETVTLNRNNASNLSVTIKASNLYHSNGIAGVTMPDGQSVRISADDTTITDPIVTISNATTVSTFDEAIHLNDVSFDEEIATNSSMIIHSPDGEPIGLRSQNDFNVSASIVMDYDGVGNTAIGSDGHFVLDTNYVFSDFNEENGTTGLRVLTGDTSTDYSADGRPKIILSNTGFIDLPARGNGENDPPAPPDGYLRMFVRSQNNSGNGTRFVVKEAGGGTSSVDP